MGVFGRCGQRTVDKLDGLLAGAGGEVRIDMEAEYSNLALDIIGISVFNYDFGSVTKESPIIQVLCPPCPAREQEKTLGVIASRSRRSCTTWSYV